MKSSCHLLGHLLALVFAHVIFASLLSYPQASYKAITLPAQIMINTVHINPVVMGMKIHRAINQTMSHLQTVSATNLALRDSGSFRCCFIFWFWRVCAAADRSLLVLESCRPMIWKFSWAFLKWGTKVLIEFKSQNSLKAPTLSNFALEHLHELDVCKFWRCWWPGWNHSGGLGSWQRR